MSVYLGFDNHVFDYLDAEPAPLRGQLIKYLTEPPRRLLISGVNVLEAVCCPSARKRISLLRLISALSGGCRPLALPGDLFSSQINAYALAQPSTTVTIGAEQEGLWIALSAPEEIDEADVEDANHYRTEQEREFRQMHESARPHFQELVDAGVAKGITSASRLIRHFKSDEKFIESTVAYFMQVSPVAHRLKGRELEFLQNLPGWQCFFLANAAAIYLRAIKTQNYGRKKNAGYFDVSQAVYLPLCHVYVTEDRPLRRVLRLAAATVVDRTQILSYLQFRDIVLRAYDPPHWQRFQDKGFNFSDTLPETAELSRT